MSRLQAVFADTSEFTDRHDTQQPRRFSNLSREKGEGDSDGGRPGNLSNGSDGVQIQREFSTRLTMAAVGVWHSGSQAGSDRR